MKKRIILLFIFIIGIMIRTDKISAVKINDIGDSNIGTFDKCGEGLWNGCISRTGYRYSIVKYNPINYKIEEVKGYKKYNDYGKKPNEWGYSNYVWNNSAGEKGLRDRIKEGGTLFEKILKETGIDTTTFFNNDYYILIEPYFIAYFDKKGASKNCSGTSGCYTNTSYTGGFSKDIAQFVKNNIYKGYYFTGFTKINQLIPCTLYIPGSSSSSDSYCKETAISDHMFEYLNLAISGNRYGKALISAKDISIGCDDLDPQIEASSSCTSTTIQNQSIGTCSTIGPEKYDVNGNTVYCTTNLSVNTENLNLYSTPDKFIKAGTIIFKDLDNLATVKLEKLCFSEANLTSEQVFGNFENEYFNYIESISVLNQNLTPTKINYTQEKLSTKKDKFYQYVATHNYNYKKTIYLEKLTGEELLKENLTSFNSYIDVEGLLTKFDHKSSKELFLPEIKFGNSYETNYGKYIKYKVDDSNKCYINIQDGIIINDKINLEFRTISTSNPFSGKNGSTRKVGENWCELNNDGTIKSCSGKVEENKLIQDVVNRNDSYNKTGQGPKYKIILTPSRIKEIRKYNKDKNNYDDVNLKCEEITESLIDGSIVKSKICISDYLTTLKDNGWLEINNSEYRKILEN